jgi:Leucine-rich repeat (LRR) protein
MQEAINRITQWIAKNDNTNTLILDLSGLHLTELPPIPMNCENLVCSDNYLLSLPELPNCKYLECQNNELVGLPELPNCETLDCDDNKLQTLPNLPKCRVLYCRNNNLTFLPQLQKCTFLSSIGDGNKYLYRPKNLAQRASSYESPNYNKFARIIQRKYRKYIKEKCSKLLINYLLKGPISIVCLYIIA